MAKSRQRSAAEEDRAAEPAPPSIAVSAQLGECLQANTEALGAVEKRLQVVQQILDEVVNEIGWLNRNIQDVSVGARDGLDGAEVVHCMECDATIRSTAEAVRRGWTALMLHEATFMGMCPNCEAPSIRCMECGVTAGFSPGEDVHQSAWKVTGEGVDGYVGRCPACEQQEAANVVKAPDRAADVATAGEKALAAEGAAAPAPSDVARPSQSTTKRRTKQQPLYLRMFMHEHLTELVRTVGYAGFSAAEGPERMKPLVAKFGDNLMRAAADEILEIDHTKHPPVARLTAQARQLAVGLLGRPPEAAASPTPSVQKPHPATDPASAGVDPSAQEAATPSRRRRRTKGSSES